MINIFLKTKARNIATSLTLTIILAIYTFIMKDMVFSSKYSISVYFFMMLAWFLIIVVLGMVNAVLFGDLFFSDPYWKKEEILLEQLSEKELLTRKEFKDYKYKFRITMVILIGLNIFIFNFLSGGIFDFYNSVGLQLSQLNYESSEKQKKAIKELYNKKNMSGYENLVMDRIKDLVENTKFDDARAWGIWYIKNKGFLSDVKFIKDYLNSSSKEVVGEAASSLLSLSINEAEKKAKKKYKDGDDLKLLIEKEKIKAKVFSKDFKYALEIKKACSRVNYPVECLLTVATFDGKESLKVINSKLKDKGFHKYIIWILANSIPADEDSRKEVEKILTDIYKNGSLESKCLLTIAFSRLKSLDAQQLMINDFYKYNKIQCPQIEKENKAGDSYVLSHSEFLQVKILDAMNLIEDLRIETRRFLYNLTLDKKRLHFKVRSKAIDVYDRLEQMFKSTLKK